MFTVWLTTAAMTPLCCHTNERKQRYPTYWLCQYSQFMIDLWSNTLIIHLLCTENAIIGPIWLPDALDVKNNPSSDQVNISHMQVNQHTRDWQVRALDPKRIIKITMAHKHILKGIIIWILCMDSLWFRSWRDFSLGWRNALAITWFPGIRHFENIKLWIKLCLGLHNCAWKATNRNSRKLAQMPMAIFLKF